MENMNMEITTSEHRAIVFKMNRKQAAAVANAKLGLLFLDIKRAAEALSKLI